MLIWVLNASSDNNSTAMCQKVSKYDQEIPQSHNHTLQTNIRHLEEESQNIYSNNTSKLFVIRGWGQ